MPAASSATSAWPTEDAVLGRSYRDGAERQRSLRRPAPVMLDGGASLALGIGGTARDGAVKCLHAHAAFALAQPGYLLGDRVLAEAAPVFPADGLLLQPVNASVDLALMEWEQGRRKLEHLDVPPKREAVYREVVDEIVAELTRRVGQTYTLDDLAREYATSAAWARLVAHRTTDNVWAHDLTIVADAAFARFARGAQDYRDRD